MIENIKKYTNDKTRFILLENEYIEYKIINGKLQIVNNSNFTELNIIFIKDSKLLLKKITNINKKSIQSAIREMEFLSKYKTKDFYNNFPKIIPPTKKIKFSTNLKPYFKLDFLKKYYKEIQNVSTNANVSYSLLNSKKTWIGDNFDYSLKKSIINLSAEIKIDTETSDYKSSTFYTKEELDINKQIKKDIKYFKENRGMKHKKIDLLNKNICIHPNVLIELLYSFIINNLDIDAFYKKDNFLTKNFNKQLFSKKLTITENPFINYFGESTSLDNDFVNTFKKDLIKKGKPNIYLSNLFLAKKYKDKSTGNNLENGVSNIEIKTGKKSLNEFKKDCILIKEILGLHTTNTTEGMLNVPVSSAIIFKDNKKISAVKNIPLNIKFEDLFKNIDISKETEKISNNIVPYIISYPK